MSLKKFKPLIVSALITAFEFIAFLIWGNVMDGSDAMGFFLITTYFIFPLTTLILSAYICFKSPVMLLPFAAIMFAAQNFMPFLLTSTFEVGMISILTFVPLAVGAAAGILIKKMKRPA